MHNNKICFRKNALIIIGILVFLVGIVYIGNYINTQNLSSESKAASACQAKSCSHSTWGIVAYDTCKKDGSNYYKCVCYDPTNTAEKPHMKSVTNIDCGGVAGSAFNCSSVANQISEKLTDGTCRYYTGTNRAGKLTNTAAGDCAVQYTNVKSRCGAVGDAISGAYACASLRNTISEKLTDGTCRYYTGTNRAGKLTNTAAGDCAVQYMTVKSRCTGAVGATLAGAPGPGSAFNCSSVANQISEKLTDGTCRYYTGTNRAGKLTNTAAGDCAVQYTNVKSRCGAVGDAIGGAYACAGEQDKIKDVFSDGTCRYYTGDVKTGANSGLIADCKLGYMTDTYRCLDGAGNTLKAEAECNLKQCAGGVGVGTCTSTGYICGCVDNADKAESPKAYPDASCP